MKMVHGWAFPQADEFLAGQMAEDGSYQRENLDAALRHVKAFELAVDGGAHVGTWTRPMAARFAQVISFEPSLDTFECLAHNLRDLKNVELHNEALGKERGCVSMTLEGLINAINSRNTGARYAVEGGSIQRVTIDGLHLPSLDFLKLDIEGGEVDALRGARKTLLQFKPIVLFEDKGHWRRYGYERSAPHDLLRSWGAVPIERASMDEIWGW